MKQKNAFIGQKVKYMGCSVIGECTGTITRLFDPYPEDYPLYREGFAIVKVDQIPLSWPYSGDDFAPSLDDIEAL